MPNNNLPAAVAGLTDEPHMRVVIRPTHYDEDRIASLSECMTIIKRATVSLRGWDFPQIGRSEDFIRGSNYFGCAINFDGRKDFWRFYQSGQFLHLNTFSEAESNFRIQLEDAAERHLGRFADYRNRDWSQTPGFISMINFLYTMTEVFEFASRLCQAGVYPDDCIIEVGLKHIEGFLLLPVEKQRFWNRYCEARVGCLERAWTIPSDILISDSAECALDATVWFFERFGWADPNVEGLRVDQRELLSLTTAH